MGKLFSFTHTERDETLFVYMYLTYTTRDKSICTFATL